MVDRLFSVEPRHLAALVAVGREGSLKAAAERLGYVRSAVSQHITHLERNVALPLVDRAPGGTAVELTAAGRRLDAHATAVIGQLYAAAADVRAVAREDGRVLRVGVTRRGGGPLLLDALAEMDRVGAGVEVRVYEHATAAEQDDAILSGDVDVALTDRPVTEPFRRRELLTDPLVLVVHRDALPAGGVRRASVRDLAPHVLLAPSTAVADLVVARMGAEGLAPRALSVYDAPGVQALVAAGRGAALLPRMAVDETDGSIVALDLDGVLPPRRLTLYWSSARRRIPGLAAFREATTRAAERRAAPVTRRTGVAVPRVATPASLPVAA